MLRKVGLLTLVCACSSPDRPAPSGIGTRPTDVPARAPEKSEAFENGKCFTAPPDGYVAECGSVTLPEGDSESSDVELAVMILYSKRDVPPDPVVYLEGGPGASAISITLYEPFAFEHILEQRDLILVDQRGTGFSTPALSCASSALSFDEELEDLGRCRDRWVANGIDLGQYNTRRNARDIDRVREALGYDDWNLYGISYGSRLALTVARDYPEHVRSMAIDGVLPLEVDLLADGVASMANSLEALGAACAAQSSCNDAYGDVVAKLFATVDELEREPVELDSGNTLTGQLAMIVVTQLMYAAEILPYMPALISGLAEGDYSLFEQVAIGTGDEASFATGMYYAVTCQDEAPFTSREVIEASRSDFDERYQLAFDANLLLDLCDVLDLPASPEAENAGVVSAVPSLVTSGAFDPVTPPEYGALAAAGLSRSQEFVLADQAHGASLSPCGMDLVNAFFEDPEARLDSSCVATLGPPDFLTGRQRLLVAPTLQFEVPVEWDEALKRRLAEAAEQARRRFPLPPY